MDTIFALASARGKAGVAVVRISGPDAAEALGAFVENLPQERGLRGIRDEDGRLLDDALILRFGHGRSFTGEEVFELHLHGSPAIINAVLALLDRNPLLRQAEAGEFTRRALENGKLDLAQVEGLADLIDAETEAQRQQAIRIFKGELGDQVERWRADLIRAAALIEASIDFAEEDVPEDVLPEVLELIQRVKADIAPQIAGAVAAERLREGFEVAIVGPPNVGKSTLLNYLAGREAAITSDVAGTTRDVIEVRMDLSGLPVTFLDTAGIRKTEDHVEELGVARALARAEAADLRVILVGSGEAPVVAVGSDDLVYRSKADTAYGEEPGISGRTGFGVDGLIGEIVRRLEHKISGVGVAVRARHKTAFVHAVHCLEEAEFTADSTGELDLLAFHLRAGTAALDSLIGHVDVEDLLDDIFSSFCIGK